MQKTTARIVVSVLVLFTFATVCQAQNKDRFGMAGCGLGSMLFGDSPGKVEQIVAATTNGTSGTQTFGITTGTSNCDPKAGPAGAKLYIETNREALAKDLSRGSGETLAGLATIAGCSDATAVGSTLQRNFTSIFPHVGVSDDHVSGSILGILSSDAALACEHLM